MTECADTRCKDVITGEKIENRCEYVKPIATMGTKTGRAYVDGMDIRVSERERSEREKKSERE